MTSIRAPPRAIWAMEEDRLPSDKKFRSVVCLGLLLGSIVSLV